MNHLLFPILFLAALLIWVAWHFIVKAVLDKFERKHADHHRR